MAGRKFTVKVEGLREVNDALGQLPKATGRNVLRRVALERLKPMADAARAKAPVDDQGGGDLRDSIAVSTKLNARQRKMARRGKAEVEAYMGPGGTGGGTPPQGVQQEFGNRNHGPQPFMRPAWDGGKLQLLDGLADDLWSEIDKATARLARKAARLASKG